MKRILSLIISLTIIVGTTAQPPRIGLALSGGGALGFAHIGAIQALEENGIYPNYIAGTSMGAIIGVLYAAGYKPAEILEIIHDKRFYQVKRLITLQSALSNLGMSKHDALHKALKELIPHNSFEGLKIPFMACVTDIDAVEAEYIDRGDLLSEYVVASASIPGVFEAMKIGKTTYIDGGVLDNLPAKYLEEKGCRYIIGIDVLPKVENASRKNSIDVAIASIRAMQHLNSKPGIEACDWLINSYAILEYHEFSFEQYIEIYQYGYKAAKEYIRNHPEMVKKLSRNK